MSATLEALNIGREEPEFWTPEERAVIDWFNAALKERRLPMEPFEFCPGVQVKNPSIMYGEIIIEINAGRRGPKGHMGTLIADLKTLRSIVEGNPGGSPACRAAPAVTERRGMDLF